MDFKANNGDVRSSIPGQSEFCGSNKRGRVRERERVENEEISLLQMLNILITDKSVNTKE